MIETSAAWIILGAALSLTLAFAAFVVVQLRALSTPIEAGLGQAFRDFAPQWQRAFEAERLARMKNTRRVIDIQRRKPAYLTIMVKPQKVISVRRAAAQKGSRSHPERDGSATDRSATGGVSNASAD